MNRITKYILIVFVTLGYSEANSQNIDSIVPPKITLSHYFNVGTNVIFGKHIGNGTRLITPYFFYTGYDLGLNIGKYFITSVGVNYTYKPYQYHLEYQDTASGGIVNGIDEYNTPYHNVFLRIRPGVHFQYKTYETQILLNGFYGVNFWTNITFNNLTPEYNNSKLTFFDTNISHYYGFGGDWINLWRINQKIALGIDIGYSMYFNSPGYYEIIYSSGTAWEHHAYPNLFWHNLNIGFLIKYK